MIILVSYKILKENYTEEADIQCYTFVRLVSLIVHIWSLGLRLIPLLLHIS